MSDWSSDVCSSDLTFLRAGETMSVGDGETNAVEVDAFDAVAIDQPEAVLLRARDHRLVDPRRDDHAAHRGLAVAVGFDAVAIVAERRSDPVEPPLRERIPYCRPPPRTAFAERAQCERG